jgi:hypothetical protein
MVYRDKNCLIELAHSKLLKIPVQWWCVMRLALVLTLLVFCSSVVSAGDVGKWDSRIKTDPKTNVVSVTYTLSPKGTSYFNKSNQSISVACHGAISVVSIKWKKEPEKRNGRVLMTLRVGNAKEVHVEWKNGYISGDTAKRFVRALRSAESAGITRLVVKSWTPKNEEQKMIFDLSGIGEVAENMSCF